MGNLWNFIVERQLDLLEKCIAPLNARRSNNDHTAASPDLNTMELSCENSAAINSSSDDGQSHLKSYVTCNGR